MDSTRNILPWTVLFILPILVSAYAFGSTKPQLDSNNVYNVDLHDRLITLENTMKAMLHDKLSMDNEVNLLKDQLNRVKHQSESKMQIVKQELLSTKEKLSKAMSIIGFLENGCVRVEPAHSHEDGITLPNNTISARKDKRLILPKSEQNPVNGIAFSVSMNKHQENLGIQQTVKFDTVITNVGSGFDPVTSVFKAPIRGLYFFSVVIMSHATEDIETEIVRNGSPLVYTYSGDSTTWNQGSQSTVVSLNAGDDVFIRILKNVIINNGNVRVFGGLWSSFSGFLIS